MATTNPSAPGRGDLARYLQAMRSFPTLTCEQEVSLAHRWREHREVEALDTLVASHLRLVAKIAIGYRGYGPVDDLIAEGTIGLMHAAKKFDPDLGFRLSTYAMWWIRASIQQYTLRSWSLVKVGTTAAQKKLFFNLRRIKAQLAAIDDGDLPPEHVAKIAHRLHVSEQDVIGMNQRLAGPDYSLNAPMRVDGDGETQDWLVDERPNQEEQLLARRQQQDRKARLAKAMEQLTDREKWILTERRLRDKPIKLEALAVKFAVSRERIRQIESGAIEKLRRAMTKPASADGIGRRSDSVQPALFARAIAALPQPMASVH